MNFVKFVACAALAMGGVYFNGRLNAAVESDIVGYTTITMEAGKWYQVGCPFVALDETEALSLATVFNNGFEDGDMAYVYSEADGSYTAPRTWGASSSGEATWLNSRGKASDITLTSGQAVFIKKVVTNTVTFAGRVDATSVVAFGDAANATWSQVIFPYPVATDINDMVWSGLSDGDKLYVYDPEIGSYQQPRTWTIGKTADDSELKWRNSRNKVTEAVIPVGSAMFIQKIDGGVATLSVR